MSRSSAYDDEPFEPVSVTLQVKLLCYSRALLEHVLEGNPALAMGCIDPDEEPAAPDGDTVCCLPLGVFVTLRLRGDLKGCIGSITTEDPLVRSIRRRTLDAAFHDRRFTPVTRADLACLSIEHSVLSPLREVSGPQSIRIGEHGVVLSLGGASAVFLPEVAVQRRWDVAEMLSVLAEKAGLESNAWKKPGARLAVFRTQHYQETG